MYICRWLNYISHKSSKMEIAKSVSTVKKVGSVTKDNLSNYYFQFHSESIKSESIC